MKRFVYSIYIKTTAETLWAALTEPEFTRQYWVGTHQESTFETGADWKLMTPDGRVGDQGNIVEADRPRRLVVTWENMFVPAMMGELTRCTYEIERQGEIVKLTLVHEAMDREESAMIEAVSQGWPTILSSLKTLLETGSPLPGTSEWPEGK